MTYLWLKAGHIIFVIFWMAGLFIAPRQLVYMHSAAPNSPEEALWAERGATLRRVILTPALIVVWVLGLALMMTIGAWTMGWFHAKLLFVLLLSGYHGWVVATAKKMATGKRPVSEKKLRLYGEIPAVIVVIVVVLAIVKPF